MVDRTNEEWISALREPVSEEALNDLRELLIRGLRAGLAAKMDVNLDMIIEDFAQEALLKILSSLDTFRGESKLTTWAQKIAIHVAYTELRRRRWRDISLQDIMTTDEGDEYTPAILTDPSKSPEQEATQRSMFEMVTKLIDQELTERQRTAILAVLQGGMPMEEVARRLNTNRNALYKMIHDARKRLQKRLEETTGMTAKEVLAMFGES